MTPEVAARLTQLNKEFYQSFASQFSVTRSRIQPGVLSLIPKIVDSESVLDIGCGNGEFALQLRIHGFRGEYVGVDFSENLLDIARESNAEFTSKTKFITADIANLNSISELIVQTRFDCVTAFAVLHHIPSNLLRIGLLHQIKQSLNSDGEFIHSNWQFMNSPSLSARIQPWNIVDLSPEEVDENDYLLDWRRGGIGYRYVHHYDKGELEALAYSAGFTIQSDFLSDGSSGNLALYQIWG